MKITRVKLSVLLVALVTLSATIYGASTRVAYEQYLNQKAQRVLDSMFGSGNFVADVTVSLFPPSYSTKYTQESNPKRNNSRNNDDDKVYLLPGYEAINNLASGDLNKFPFDSVTRYSEARIRRVTVNLLMNKSLASRKYEAQARRVIEQVLDINTARGDEIVIEKMTFYPQLAAVKRLPGPSISEQLLSLENLLIVTGLILFIVFLVVYIMLQLRAIQATRESAISDAPGASVNVNPNIEIPQSDDGGSSGSAKIDNQSIKRYFDFISEQNIDDLIYMLRKENVSIENVSVIISFLPAKLASRLLGELDLNNQAVVTTNILSQRLVNRAYIEKLEGKVREWIECFVGGKSTFEKLFSYVSGEVKKQLMVILGKNNPEAYREFRNSIIIFDDIRFLDDDELKLVLSEANVELLASALVSVEEETYQKIDINLTKNAKDMIQQYLDLKAKSLSKHDVESAQEYILNIVEKLEREGNINLRSKITA